MAIYRITFSGSIPGETFNFGLHVDGAAGSAGTVSADAATAMTDWWTDATDPLNAHFSTDVEILVEIGRAHV